MAASFRRPARQFGLLLSLVLIATAAPVGQEKPRETVTDPVLAAQFGGVLPGADTFVHVNAKPPYYRAYRSNPDSDEPAEMLGLVFLTHEVFPYEVAYAGRIDILAGMTGNGEITGIEVLVHDEPYGDFSIDRPEFAAQFRGKSILDPLRVGKDIDSVTRATITVEGATRAIRKSARQIARQHLQENEGQ